MEVIRHHTVSEHIDWELEGGLGEKLDEISIIGLAEEQLSPIVPAIRHVNRTSDG